MPTESPVLSQQCKEALSEFRDLLKLKLQDNLLHILLFGSTARGEATRESDIDVLVILKNKDDTSQEAVLDAVVDVNIKHDVFISVIIKSKAEYQYPPFRQTLLYTSIREEGFPVW
ncbi:MAG: nucleotidyltransferase domain-containing protein [Clostridia bacterium]|nr:nucleotidyltransferase domain-containing protein [Clostridia bacterium]